ncbi:uncharacterized protein LOC131313866 [Rhododendron vialii]|uniref:uncharacterized protein LOC131313866 n=1 Tax=Rhododendron vialii TaxID=182163 RepID=UPI00265EC3EC|nr:uncharacterized protein LOC131313866 [Rhododendron vialii]
MGKVFWERCIYGVVIRDANGMFMAAASRCLSWCKSPELAEAMAVRRGVQVGLQLGLNAVMVESDSKAVIDMINGHTVVSQSVNSTIHDVKVLSNDFQSCMFLFARRSSNSVAHTLASKGLGGLDCSLWTESPHVWLLDSLSRDGDSS